MKTTLLITLFFCLLAGCRKETTNPNDTFQFDPLEAADSDTLIKYGYDTISFERIDLTGKRLGLYEVYVSSSVPHVVHKLCIHMTDTAYTGTKARYIEFSVLDPENSEDRLMESGDHYATGDWGDDIHYDFDGNNYQLYQLKSDEFVIHLDSFFQNRDGTFARGYIEILKPIYWQFPACFLVDRYIFPGDADYLDYCTPFYFVPARIYFDNIPD